MRRRSSREDVSVPHILATVLDTCQSHLHSHNSLTTQGLVISQRKYNQVSLQSPVQCQNFISTRQVSLEKESKWKETINTYWTIRGCEEVNNICKSQRCGPSQAGPSQGMFDLLWISDSKLPAVCLCTEQSQAGEATCEMVRLLDC